MISKSFGYLLTGTCIFNVKNDISVHINRNQFRLNMQYINPMLLRGEQLTEALSSVISDYYRKLRVLLSQFCTILGDAFVRNRAFNGYKSHWISYFHITVSISLTFSSSCRNHAFSSVTTERNRYVQIFNIDFMNKLFFFSLVFELR